MPDNRVMPRMLAALAALLLCVACAPARDAAERRPNIILFPVDDMGQQDVSVPMLDQASALNARFRTPNLEKLASRGVRFSNAYSAAPVCTPSRTAILTGQAPARTHITYWTLEKDTDTSSNHKNLVQPAWEVNGLQPSPDLLPELLRKPLELVYQGGLKYREAAGVLGVPVGTVKSRIHTALLRLGVAGRLVPVRLPR